MADNEERSRASSLASRFRGVLGQVREKGAASLREVQRTAKTGVSEAGQRLKSGQEAVGTAVEIRRVIKQAEDAKRRGNPALAYRLLEEEIDAKGEDPKLVLAFWAAALACERAREAVPLMQKLVRKEAATQPERAAEHWLELHAGAPTARVDPAALVRIAPALVGAGQLEMAVHALRQAVDPENPGLSPGMAMRLAETAREIDPGSALAAVRRVLDDPELHASKRERLTGLVAELEGTVAGEAAAAAKAEASEGASAAAPDPASLDAESLAQQIGNMASNVEDAASAGATQANESFMDLAGEEAGTGLELAAGGELDAPQHEIENERFVALDSEDAGPDLAVESPPVVAAVAAEPSLALDPDSLDLAPDDGDLADAESWHEQGASSDLGEEPLLGEVALDAEEYAPSDDDANVFGEAESFEIGMPEQAGPLEIAEVEAAETFDTSEAVVVGEALEALSPAIRFETVKLLQGVPSAFDERGLILDVDSGRRGRVEWSKIEALAVAEVAGLAMHPVVIVDLVTNWHAEGDTALKVMRLRSDRFDARALMTEAGEPVEAFRAFLAALFERSGAVPLPSPDAALGLEPAHYETLERYEREVLQVGR